MWKRKKNTTKNELQRNFERLSINLKSRIWLKNKHTTKIRRNIKLHLQQFWFRNRQICIYFDFCNLSPSVQAWFSVIDPETFFVLGPAGGVGGGGGFNLFNNQFTSIRFSNMCFEMKAMCGCCSLCALYVLSVLYFQFSILFVANIFHISFDWTQIQNDKFGDKLMSFYGAALL